MNQTDNARVPHILVVDDEWMNRELLQTVLESAGYTVSLANSAPRALSTLGEISPDLALIDVRLPREDDGYNLVRSIRAMPEYAQLKIMMITALESATEEVKARDAGADGFVSRIGGVNALLRAIERILA